VAWQGCQGTGHGNQVSAHLGLHREHRSTVFLVEEGDAPYQSGEAFLGPG